MMAGCGSMVDGWHNSREEYAPVANQQGTAVVAVRSD
jgi:hypothetical protein